MSAEKLPPMLPAAADRAHFFEACQRGEMLVQGCAACGHRQFYPRRWCLSCDSTDLDWVRVSGDGRLVTFSIVRRAPSASHLERVPYVIGIVELVEGPQMLASVVGIEHEDLAIDMAVRLTVSEAPAPAFGPRTGDPA